MLVKYQGLQSPTSPGAVAIAGSICGIASVAVTYPVDLAKTAYQKNRLQVGRALCKAPPLHYFRRVSYSGCLVACTRSAFTNAIMFSIFEYSKKVINRLEEGVKN